MSNPSWLVQSGIDNPGHVPARMETMTSITNPSISVSTQQTPKKCAPVVAPKPKYNPYKQNGQPVVQVVTEGEFPAPPPSVEGLNQVLAEFPPPPNLPLDRHGPGASSDVQTGRKSLEERRSSLDAEIDSLTSILADLESSSPYRPRQSHGGSGTLPLAGSLGGAIPGTMAAPSPVIGHQRMVIPAQPLLTATKKTGGKPGTSPGPTGATRTLPQPVPASYSTASTPAQPAFNVQVKSAQPNPHYLPPGPEPGVSLQYTLPPGRSPEPARHGPPRPAPTWAPEPGYGYTASTPPSRYQDLQPVPPAYAGGYAGEPAHRGHSPWRPEPAYPPGPPTGPYRQLASPRKVHGMEPALGPAAMTQQSKNVYQPPAPAPVPAPAPGSAPAPRPEDELNRLTKKLLFDMENPPSDDYFGQCVRCGESVVGEGAGCTAMEQVFHVDCFSCVTCGNKLRGHAFYAVDKKSYCELCYISTLEQCSVCSRPIMERILRATGKAYHPQCFTCVVCHRSLDGVPFTVDTTNQVHCIDDFHRKFAPRCSVCGEAIMPAVGQEETVRIVALDRDFHVQCYRCEDCGSPLSDGDTQGCYPLDGHVFCKTCNGQRIQALTAKASTDL